MCPFVDMLVRVNDSNMVLLQDDKLYENTRRHDNKTNENDDLYLGS